MASLGFKSVQRPVMRIPLGDLIKLGQFLSQHRVQLVEGLLHISNFAMLGSQAARLP